MKEIRFTTNWNNKLQCQAFTTLRPASSSYCPGERVEIILQGKPYSNYLYEIVMVQTIEFSKISEGLALIDTGYSLNEFKQIVKKMYQKRYWWQGNQTKFSLIFIRKTNILKHTQANIGGAQ